MGIQLILFTSDFLRGILWEITPQFRIFANKFHTQKIRFFHNKIYHISIYLVYTSRCIRLFFLYN